METIQRFTSQVRRNKKIIFISSLVIGFVISLFCLTKYVKCSKSIPYDLSEFDTKEGFSCSMEGDSIIISPEGENFSTDICTESSFTILSKGNYTYCFAYDSNSDFKVYIQAGDSVYEEYILPAGSHIEYLPFSLKQPVVDGRLRISYGGYGLIKINALLIESDKPITSDWLFVMVIMWIIILSSALLLNSYYERKLTKGHLKEIIFVLVISALSIPYVILSSKGIFWGVDTNAQNIRIEIIKDAMLQGQFPAVIGPSMCNGYGSIEPMMYPSLFLYPFALLRILKVSPVMVYKFAHILINLLTCSSCYVCTKKITRSCKAAGLSLIAFSFSKFHLMTIGHYDWTYGMGISMIFFFVLLIGLYEIFFGNKYVWPYLSLGMWGIFNSHIMTVMFATVVVGLFALFYLKKSINEDRLKYFVYAVLASIPMCIYRIYTFLDTMLNNRLNTSTLNLNMFGDNTYTIQELFLSPVTFIMLFSLLASILYLFLAPNRFSNGSKFAAVSIIISLFCIAMASSYMPWDKIFENRILGTAFGFIQFPNRLFQVAVPLCCITIGIIYRNMLRRNDAKAKVFISAIFVAVAFSSVWSYSNEINEIRGLDKVFSEKVIGDVLSFPGMTDYVPDGEDYDSYSGRSLLFSNDSISVTEGSYEKMGTNISAEVNCSNSEGYIDFPVFAYKGYICKDVNDNRLKTGIGKNHRLRVYFDKNPNPLYIRIRYKVPGIYYVLLIVSYMSIFAVVTYNKAFLARLKKKIHYYEFLKSFDYRVL